MGKNLIPLKAMLDDLLSNISNVECLVIVQKPEHYMAQINSINDSYNCRIIALDNIGLSNSRNKALELATAKYIWLLDDDVVIEKQRLQSLLLALEASQNEDFIRVWINCLENKNSLYKKYKSINKISKLNLLQFSSIEIICRRKFVQKHNIRFNERVGLGTPYQATEEVNFLLDAWDKGGKFNSIEEPFVQHTCIFDDRILANDKIMMARGATASRYGAIGIALIIRWGMRYFLRYKKLSYISQLIRGYMLGYSGLNRMIDETNPK